MMVRGSEWGASVDGEAGLVRAQLERSLPLAMLTAQVAKLGMASRKLLEVLAGAWTSVLQFRKRCMCLLEELFAEIQLYNYETVFNLQAKTVDELWTLVFLAPLFCADLRASIGTEFSLVDASNDWTAEVSAELSPALSKEMLRHKLSKAAWSRLLSPWKALQRSRGKLQPDEEVPEGEAPARSHPLWTETVKSKKFKLKVRKKIKRKEHINISELRAALDAEQRRGSRKPNSKILLGSDSQVVLGALVKGRSSAASLNSLLRRSLPSTLGHNVYLFPQYIPTDINSADDPTRNREVREPQSQPPPWLIAAEDGKFEELDAMLRERNLDGETLARLPPEPEAVLREDGRASERQVRRANYSCAEQRRSGLKRGKKEIPPSCRTEPWLPRRRLTAEAVALLTALPAEQFVLPHKDICLEELLRKPGHLDLFSGSRGAAKALAQRSGRWAVTFDYSHSPTENLLDLEVRRTIESLIAADCFLSLGAGPVCASFSRAVRPPVRSKAFPGGLPDVRPTMLQKVADGNSFSEWMAFLVRTAVNKGMAVWVENPAGSFMWQKSEWQELLAEGLIAFFATDQCRWGTPWRKRTNFAGNLEICGQKLLCECVRPHIRLVGYSQLQKCSWTKVAESYPTSLCKLLARAVTEFLKPVERRVQFDPAACARSSSRRIGEAKNPGPRARQHENRGLDLERVELISHTTVLLEKKVREKYLAWLQRELSPESWEGLCSQPHLQVFFLRSYGNWLFQKGEPLYVYRHLVVFCQQQYPTLRPAMSEAWNLLSRWEVVNPVTHRPPLPKMILDAFLAVAWSWGWYRWCAITAIGFHGAMRVGEPLRACRADLVFPEEAMLDLQVLFVNVTSPKAGRRGKGKVQHARLTDATAIEIARRAFFALKPDERLFPATPATYRRRWDKLLENFRIPKTLNLTPGGLRGGGAIYLYHNAAAVTDILWRMRLKHLATLESYLQEIAAVSVLTKLSFDSRRSLMACSRFLSLMLQT